MTSASLEPNSSVPAPRPGPAERWSCVLAFQINLPVFKSRASTKPSLSAAIILPAAIAGINLSDCWSEPTPTDSRHT